MSVVDYTACLRVWGLLARLSARLPETQRPGPPRGSWQLDALRHLLSAPNASLQGARQGAGKTFVAAVIACAHLLAGERVAVAMPTLRQGRGILARRVLDFMTLLEPALGLRRTRDSALDSAWSNGAELICLSTDDAAQRSAQGYTCGAVVIDEAHVIAFADLGSFSPLLQIARKAGHGRMLLLGTGGATDSAVEQAKSRAGWVCMTLDDAAIAAADDAQRERIAQLDPADARLAEPGWREVFAQELESSDPASYDQFFRCLPVVAGGRLIFPPVPGVVRPAIDAGFTPRWFAGIDVGRDRDQSVVAVLERRGEVTNLVALHKLAIGTPYTRQAREIAALVGTPYMASATMARYYTADRAGPVPTSDAAGRVPTILPRDIFIEVNGPGAGLYDILTDPDDPLLWGISPVQMSYELKSLLIAQLARDIRKGRFGVADEQARAHLSALRLDVDGAGRLSWEHSDVLSALLCARCGLLRVSGV